MRPITKRQSSHRIFYQREHACLYSDTDSERIFIADAALLAQKSSSVKKVLLYQLDSARSIIGTVVPRIPQLFTPYGASAPGTLVTVPAFSGQPLDRASNTYPLGNGRRFYSPSIMRFTAPDNVSPFNRGGYNAYVYCQGDPINRHDPNGQWWVLHRIINLSARLLHRALNSAAYLTFNTPAPTLLRMVDSVAAASVQLATRQFRTGWNLLPPSAQSVIATAVAVPTVLTAGVTVLAAVRTRTVIVPSLQETVDLLTGQGSQALLAAVDIRRG